MWEKVAPDTFRLKVFGGWVVRYGGMIGKSDISMVFVPDSVHQWVIK